MTTTRKIEAAAPAEPRHGLSAEDLEAVCAAGTWRTYGAGEVIFRLGETGDTMYVVRQGQVKLAFDAAQTSKRLGPGEFFGELALLAENHARLATAVAAEASQLVLLDEAAFSSLAHEHPRLFFALLRRTCAYLLASEQSLVADLRQRNRELAQTLDFLRRTREELDYHELLAQTDALTGLYNRRCFQQQLEKFLNRAEITGSQLALILVDLDGFKPVNDTFGHAAGDAVLRQVAAALRGCVRSTDLPCRIGGDEFAVLLPDTAEPQARLRAEQIRAALHALELGLPDPGVRVGASIGGSLHRAGQSAAELFDRADGSLYAAKRGGRNRVVWSSPDSGRPPD